MEERTVFELAVRGGSVEGIESRARVEKCADSRLRMAGGVTEQVKKLPPPDDDALDFGWARSPTPPVQLDFDAGLRVVFPNSIPCGACQSTNAEVAVAAASERAVSLGTTRVVDGLMKEGLSLQRVEDLTNNPSSDKAAQKSRHSCRLNRWVCLVLFCMHSFFIGPHYLNWAPLRHCFVSMGMYSWECQGEVSSEALASSSQPAVGVEGQTMFFKEDLSFKSSHAEEGPEKGACREQQVSIARLFTVCTAADFGFSFFAGVVLDGLGPRAASTLGALCMLLGWLMICISSQGLQLYLPGIAIYGMGIDAAFYGVLTLPVLFPSHENLIMALLMGFRCAGWAAPAILERLVAPDGFGLPARAVLLACGGAALGISVCIAAFAIPKRQWIRGVIFEEEAGERHVSSSLRRGKAGTEESFCGGSIGADLKELSLKDAVAESRLVGNVTSNRGEAEAATESLTVVVQHPPLTTNKSVLGVHVQEEREMEGRGSSPASSSLACRSSRNEDECSFEGSSTIPSQPSPFFAETWIEDISPLKPACDPLTDAEQAAPGEEVKEDEKGEREKREEGKEEGEGREEWKRERGGGVAPGRQSRLHGTATALHARQAERQKLSLRFSQEDPAVSTDDTKDSKEKRKDARDKKDARETTAGQTARALVDAASTQQVGFKGRILASIKKTLRRLRAEAKGFNAFFRLYVASPAFWPLVPYFCLTLLRGVFFASSSEQLVPEALRLLYILLAVVFVFPPLLGLLTDWVGIGKAMATVNTLGTLVVLLSLIGWHVDSPALSYVICCVFAAYSPAMSAQVYLYVMAVFPPSHIGKLLGLVMTIGGFFSLLDIPLFELCMYTPTLFPVVLALLVGLSVANFALLSVLSHARRCPLKPGAQCIADAAEEIV